METKAWEKAGGEAQQMVVDQWAVEKALAEVRAVCVGRAEVLSLCAALLRETERETTVGVVVMAVGFVADSATAMSDFLETDPVTALVMPGQVSALVRTASPALWREIAATVKDLDGEWARGPAA